MCVVRIELFFLQRVSLDLTARFKLSTHRSGATCIAGCLQRQEQIPRPHMRSVMMIPSSLRGATAACVCV